MCWCPNKWISRRNCQTKPAEAGAVIVEPMKYNMNTIKHHSNRMIPATILAGAIALGTAWAVDLPVPPPPPSPAPDQQAAEPQKDNAPEPMPMVQNGKIAYLGVGSASVPELLATHIGLEKGQGVVVRALDPDGPAAAAGIAENDVLLRVNDKAVGSQLELRDAVLAAKPGDEVKLSLIHEGKPINKTVKLGSRPAAMAIPHGAAPPLHGQPEDQARRVREAIEQDLKALEGAHDIEAELKRLEQRMRFMFRGLGQDQADNDAGKDADDIQFSSVATIRMLDDEGSVEIEMKNGSKHVRVRDNDGKVLWEGPWDTKQDKAAAPEDVRERIEALNIDMVEGQMGPGKFEMKIAPAKPKAPKEDAPKPKDQENGE